MKISELQKGAHIHLMGICGTAMASLAGMLQDLGFKVTGSDQNVYPPMSTMLRKLGIEIKEGYKKENLVPRPDFVIVGNVITRKHEEAEALLNSDIAYTSLPAAMGELIIGHRNSIVVCGTHGKTTTSSIMTWMATCAGKQPGFMIGGIPVNFEQSFKVPEKDLFVIEGDEYDTAFFDKVPKFIHYRPKYAILTSVEFDHADIYADLDAVKAAFLRLADVLAPDGILIHNAEDENIKSLAPKFTQKKVSYGFNTGTYQAKKIRFENDACVFDVVKAGQVVMQAKLAIYGRHNIANALACIALGLELNWEISKIQESLQSFKGVKRRLELIGSPKSIKVLEDFAHHPTAVDATLSAVRERHPNAKIFAIFEPRSATSRRKIFQRAYVEAFEQADNIQIAKAYNQNSIDSENRFSSEDLVKDLKQKAKRASYFEKVEEAIEQVKKEARAGDVVLIMSNGSFDNIYNKILAALN